MKNRKALALIAILALVAAACGGTADEVVEEEVVETTEAPATTAAPTTTAAPAADLATAAAKPTAAATADPTTTAGWHSCPSSLRPAYSDTL